MLKSLGIEVFSEKDQLDGEAVTVHLSLPLQYSSTLRSYHYRMIKEAELGARWRETLA